MATQTKTCIACAEPIQIGAQLCKHCKTMQDDKRFIAKATKPQVVSPSKTEAKAKPFVPGECVRCSSQVSNASLHLQYLCSNCIYRLNKSQRTLYNTRKPIRVCSTCNDRIHLSETSSQCDKCSKKNGMGPFSSGSSAPGKTNVLISWWAQLILVFAALISQGNISGPWVFWFAVGAQLLGWNVFISIGFAIAWFVMKRNSRDTQRVRSWLYSSLAFLFLGVLITLITLASLALANR